MELVIEPFDTYPCCLGVFTINGKNASQYDFGDMHDRIIEDNIYGCHNRCFEPKSPTSKILQRYNITVDEYNTICAKLEDELYIDHCEWCV